MESLYRDMGKYPITNIKYPVNGKVQMTKKVISMADTTRLVSGLARRRIYTLLFDFDISGSMHVPKRLDR